MFYEHHGIKQQMAENSISVAVAENAFKASEICLQKAHEHRFKVHNHCILLSTECPPTTQP